MTQTQIAGTLGMLESGYQELYGRGPVCSEAEGMSWTFGTTECTYVPDAGAFLKQHGLKGLGKVASAKLLQVAERSGDEVIVQEYVFAPEEGLLTVLGVELPADMLQEPDAMGQVAELCSVEIDNAGVPEVTEKDEAAFWNALFRPLAGN